MIDTTYVVTKAPEMEGIHFVHARTCQVLPDQELEELGTFDGCEAAVSAARERYHTLNACALCCPSCYLKG